MYCPELHKPETGANEQPTGAEVLEKSPFVTRLIAELTCNVNVAVFEQPDEFVPVTV
jgi:hypothetical protein